MAKKNIETKEEIKTIDMENIKKELNNYLAEEKDKITEELTTKVDEQVEFCVNKRMKEEEKKIVKGKTGKIIRRDFIILLLIGVIAYFSYCLYDIDYFNIRTKEKEPTPTIKDNKEDENKSDDNKPNENPIPAVDEHDTAYYIENYGYLLDNLNIEDEAIYNLYQEKTTLDNISNDLILKIAYKNLNREAINTNNDMITFNSNDLLASATKIFGNTLYFKHEMFSYNNTKFMYYNDTYIGLKEAPSKTGFISKVAKAEEKDNKIIFTVVIAKLNSENQLINSNNEIIIENYNNENILDYKDKLSTYQIVFDNDLESGNYLFKSLTKINEMF